MPLEVCKNSSKICKDIDYAFSNKGYSNSQSSTYYGYKLQAICSLRGIFKGFDISPASVHDIHYLKDIKNQIKDCTLIVDKWYYFYKTYYFYV